MSCARCSQPALCRAASSVHIVTQSSFLCCQRLRYENIPSKSPRNDRGSAWDLGLGRIRAQPCAGAAQALMESSSPALTHPCVPMQRCHLPESVSVSPAGAELTGVNVCYVRRQRRAVCAAVLRGGGSWAAPCPSVTAVLGWALLSVVLQVMLGTEWPSAGSNELLTAPGINAALCQRELRSVSCPHRSVWPEERLLQ